MRPDSDEVVSSLLPRAAAPGEVTDLTPAPVRPGEATDLTPAPARPGAATDPGPPSFAPGERSSLSPAPPGAEAASPAARPEGGSAADPIAPAERYRVEAEIGRGGMGTVYRAYDRVLKRLVALKVTLASRGQDQDILDRFRDEAQATAQLEHPGIVPVHDMGRDSEGRLYFTMKLVRGRTLASVLEAVRAGHAPGSKEPSAGGDGGGASPRRQEPSAGGDGGGVSPPRQEPSRFRLLEIFVEVARAISYAHDRGVVHRDLKPQNIMLGAHDEVHVMDWGIAKVVGRGRAAAPPVWDDGEGGTGEAGAGAGSGAGVDRDAGTHRDAGKDRAGKDGDAGKDRGAGTDRGAGGAGTDRSPGSAGEGSGDGAVDFGSVATDSGRAATLAGAVVGTPSFMSPEQARGDAAAIGPCSDVYALGAVLFSIIAGQAPFSGGVAGVLAQVRSSAPPPSPRAIARAVPRELDAICRKAMAKRPRDRYPTARALADDVHAYLEGQPVAAYPERLAGRLWKAAKRHRGVSATVAVAVVLALVGSLAALVRIDRARRLAESNLERVHHEKAIAALADGDARTAAILLATALSVEDTQDARERLIAARTKGCRLAFRASEDTQPRTVAVSPDGRRVASAGNDGTVRLRALESGRVSAELRGHTGTVTRLAFSPDGRSLASAGLDGTARIFDVPADGAEGAGAAAAAPPTSTARLVLAGAEGRIWSCAWSPDGARLAFSSADQSIRIHDARTGAPVRVLRGHEEEVASLAFDRSGRRLASASCDLTARVWDLESGAELLKLEDHETWVNAVAWSPDGALLVTASDALRLWDPVTGRRLETIRPHESGIQDIAWSPDGRLLATMSTEAGARVIDVDARRVLISIRGHAPASEWSAVAFTPDGRRIATAGLERAVHLFELPPEGTAEGTAARSPVAAIPGHRREIWAVRYASDGRAVVSSSTDDAARVSDVATGRLRQVLRQPGARIIDIDLSADGRLVATAGTDALARVFDAVSGAQVAILRGHSAGLNGVRFRADGRQVVTSSGGDPSARVFDVLSGAELRALPHEVALNTLAVSPDGRLCATAAGKVVHIHEIDTGRPVRALIGHDGEVDTIAWSADGRRIATAGWDRTARIWDVASGASLRTLTHDDSVYCVAFRPDGRRLVTTCEDQAARIFDVDSGALLYALRGHGGNVVGAAWSPDGRSLATGGADRTVRIWDLSEVERILAAPAAALLLETRRDTGLRMEGLVIRPAERP